MEVIIVLSVLAMFAAMAVPLAGRLEARGRVRETERRLELVREAMLGARGAAFAGGRRALAGYAGDLGGLPPLRRSVWDAVYQRWVWDVVFANEMEAQNYWASGMGQPRNLWVPLPPLLPGGAPNPLAARWKGPYLHEPRDEFPANAEHLRWTRDDQLAGLTLAQRRTAEEANREIEMRQTAGRLADAWGRSLLFFYVPSGPVGTESFLPATVQATVYVVSEGPDLHSSLLVPAYQLTEPENRDNLVLVITPQEWRDEVREAETRRLLQAAADALVGRFGPVDRLGRPVFGGFVGDQGRWPDLFVWQGAPAPWRRVTGHWQQDEAGNLVLDAQGNPVWVSPAPDVHGAVYGQPRGLWTRDTDGGGTPDLRLPPDPGVDRDKNVVPLGFGWRGPYLPRPEGGTGEAEVLRDAWGVPLDFRLSHAGEADPPPEQTLTITSAGQDGTLGTADDLRETVSRHWDVRRPGTTPPETIFTLEGTVVNDTGSNLWLRVRLHASPAYQPVTLVQRVYGRTTVDGQVYGRTTVDGQAYENIGSFSLPVRRSSAGPRLLELVVVDSGGQFLRRRDWTTVHVGSGGTATPEREPLVLRARDP
jgi:type II secretory pathway pseudopilin PulG